MWESREICLSISVRRVHGDKKICEMCDRPFHDKATLNRHIKNKHDFEAYLCPVCNASYSSKEYLNARMKSHISSKCEICFEEFDDNYARPDKVPCSQKWM